MTKYLQGINGGCHLFPALAVKDKSAKPSDKISMEILKIFHKGKRKGGRKLLSRFTFQVSPSTFDYA
jgi:hypothetical protein